MGRVALGRHTASARRRLGRAFGSRRWGGRSVRLARGVTCDTRKAGGGADVAVSLVLRPSRIYAHRSTPLMVLGIDVDGLESSGRPSAIHPRVKGAERIELGVEQSVAVREARNTIEADEAVCDRLAESHHEALVIVDRVVRGDRVID